MKRVQEEEWPDIIMEPEELRRPEYVAICDAVGDLTAAILEAKLHGVLTPIVAESLHGFLGGVQETLEEHMKKP